MLNKQEIKTKLETIKTQTELLNLSQHKALGEYIIVVPAEIQEPGITSRATQFEDRPEIGLVVSVGANVAEEVSVGDVVFFGKYSHVQITHDDIVYLVMRVEDIYCVA